jgi:periplasmic protein CpxP/Spy
MRRIFAFLILIAGSAAFAGEAALQEAESPAAPETVIPGRTPEDTVNTLAKRLALTEEQKAKILPIIVERRRKIQEVWTTSEQFVRQKQVQERGINKESDRRINALLNGDQQKAYLAWQQERKAQRRLKRAQSESSS